MNADDLLTTPEAACYLGVTNGYLRNLRSEGRGPVYLKDGRGRVRYDKADLDRWVRFSRAGGGGR